MNYRKFDAADLERCTHLFLKVYSGDPWYDEWPSYEMAETYLREYIENPCFKGYVVEIEEKLVGVCFGHTKTWWQGRECYIDEFYVDHAEQGKGIGSKLIDYVKEDLKQEGISCMTLLTERGYPAEGFYQKNGFRTKEDVIFMVNIY